MKTGTKVTGVTVVAGSRHKVIEVLEVGEVRSVVRLACTGDTLRAWVHSRDLGIHVTDIRQCSGCFAS